MLWLSGIPVVFCNSPIAEPGFSYHDGPVGGKDNIKILVSSLVASAFFYAEIS